MLVRNGLDCLAFLMRVDDHREGQRKTTENRERHPGGAQFEVQRRENERRVGTMVARNFM